MTQSILLLIVLSLFVAACSGNSEEGATTTPAPITAEDNVQPVQEEADTGAEAGTGEGVDGADGADGGGGQGSGSSESPTVGEARLTPAPGFDLKIETFGDVSRAVYTRENDDNVAFITVENFSGTTAEAAALANADGAASAEKVDLSGCNALRLERFSPDGDGVSISVFCVRNGKLYTAAAEGPRSSYDDLEAQLSAVLGGFSFAGSDATGS